MMKKPNNNKQQKFRPSLPNFPGRSPYTAWFALLLLIACGAFLFWYNSVHKDLEAISYSKLLDAIESKQVATLRVQDQYAQGEYANGKRFTTYIAPTEKFWDLLKENHINVEVYPQEKQAWGMYFLFLAFLFLITLLVFLYFRQQQGGGDGKGGKIFNVGKSKARFFAPNTITVTFNDVAGVQDAKEDLRDIVEFLKNPERYERLGAKIPRGILLSGAPGNGKTLLAKAVAGEAHCPFFSISGSDFVEVFVGVGASRVRDLFAQARRHAPCIVFIDEIDAVGRQRGIGLGGGNDEREQTLNQLLAEMDGFSTEHGSVIILAATNRPDVLDKALLRPGRFDRIIEVPYPDVTSRESILEVHAKSVKLAADVDLKKIARGTPGFTGADLKNLINEAALLASKEHANEVSVLYFERARDKILLGAERKTLVQTDKEKLMTAYHEAGHTLLNLLLPETDPFHKVTIVPRGQALGVSWSLPENDKTSSTKAELEQRISVCLGGLLAEKMIFSTQTTGVSNDLMQATRTARAMVRRYGMSSLGPLDYNVSEEHPYLGRDIQKSREFSDHTAQRIDEEVERIINQCYENGNRLLEENKDRLNLLAKTLVEKETLHAQEVYELLDIPPRKTHNF